LGNSYSGIYMDAGAEGNTIGGEAFGAGNIISGNGNYGVADVGPGTTQNVIAGDKIGTDFTAGVPISNSFGGIVVSGGGSLTLESDSVISGGMFVTQTGAVNISGSGNAILGRVYINSGGYVNIFGANNSVSGSVTAVSNGTFSVFNSGNKITGSLYLSASSLTISGSNDTLSVDATVKSGGL